MEERIFQPLGLDATSFVEDGRLEPPYSRGYLGGGKELLDVTAISPSHYWAAGNIVAPANEVMRFYEALFNGELLSDDSMEEMESFAAEAPGLERGLGLARGETRCGSWEGHDGSVPGYDAVARHTDSNRQIVLLIEHGDDGRSGRQPGGAEGAVAVGRIGGLPLSRDAPGRARSPAPVERQRSCPELDSNQRPPGRCLSSSGLSSGRTQYCQPGKHRKVRRAGIPSSTHDSLAAVFDPSDPRNILFERDHSFIVFISSKMTGGALAAERQAAMDVVERFRPARAWAWERDAPAGSYYSKEECIRRAGTSDALILVVEDELTPITAAEFDAARAGTANAIVLARRGVARNKRLTRLIKDARRWAITKEFGDLDELESEIDLALWEWFVRGGRTLALQTRELRKNDIDAFLLDEVEMTDQSGQTVNLRNAINGWREEELDDAERAEEALWELYGWAAMATDEDQFPLARILLDELWKLIPAAVIDEVARGWILNLEGQIASGEGRRDPATQYFEQMRQIGVATDEKRLISIALQNLGIQAVIAGDHDLAKEHFQESFELKKETEDVYGATQIALNMCNVFMDEGSPQLARELLDDLEPYVRGPETHGLQAALHGQRGMVFKEEGLPDEAKRQFQESLRLARRADSVARQVLALQNLGANAMERDKPREALRWLRKATELAEALGDRNRVKTLRAATGTALAELTRWQEAAEQFVVAAQIAAELGDVPAEARAWADVAACWSRLDRPEEAQKLIDQALSNPQADRDPDWRAGQLRNLAEVLEQLGKSEEAIQRLDEASRLAENAEQKEQCAAAGRGDRPGAPRSRPSSAAVP